MNPRSPPATPAAAPLTRTSCGPANTAWVPTLHLISPSTATLPPSGPAGITLLLQVVVIDRPARPSARVGVGAQAGLQRLDHPLDRPRDHQDHRGELVDGPQRGGGDVGTGLAELVVGDHRDRGGGRDA